ncbi:MAG: hypothetical protein ACTS47_01260 [Candidatus Hodgkinia cicadicola]
MLEKLITAAMKPSNDCEESLSEMKQVSGQVTSVERNVISEALLPQLAELKWWTLKALVAQISGGPPF